jgi:hypothetical protein
MMGSSEKDGKTVSCYAETRFSSSLTHCLIFILLTQTKITFLIAAPTPGQRASGKGSFVIPVLAI